MKINLKKGGTYFEEGEIWWASIGINIGVETDGKGDDFMRPMIVLKKYNQFSFLGIPLTTSQKTHDSRFSIGCIAGKEADANMSQIRSLDGRRLKNKIGRLENAVYVALKEKTSQVNFG